MHAFGNIDITTRAAYLTVRIRADRNPCLHAVTSRFVCSHA